MTPSSSIFASRGSSSPSGCSGARAAGIGEGRPIPVHEFSEAPGIAHELISGLEKEVVGVAENRLRAEHLDLFGCERFHRCFRANDNERRRLNGAVWRRNPSPARGGGP